MEISIRKERQEWHASATFAFGISHSWHAYASKMDCWQAYGSRGRWSREDRLDENKRVPAASLMRLWFQIGLNMVQVTI